MLERVSVRYISMMIALVVICLFFALHPDGGSFLSPQNLSNLSIELAITATLALGMLLVLLPGMIDLSVGSGVGLIGGVGAVLVTRGHIPAPVAMLAGLVLAVVIWGLMGRMIIHQRVPAFIITLGGLLVFKGAHWLAISNSTVPVVGGGQENVYSLLTTCYLPAGLGWGLAVLACAGLGWRAWRERSVRRRFALDYEDSELVFLKLFVSFQGIALLVLVMNRHQGVPLALVILIAVAVAVHAITRHTRFGRYLYAIGGNEDAAYVSGVPIERVVVTAFILLGALVALTGFMQTAYGGYSTTTVGNLMELDAIAACVIGGTSLKGGRGSVLGVLFGAVIMALLLNGMTLLAVPPEVKMIARGGVLVLAVWMDVALSLRSASEGE